MSQAPSRRKSRNPPVKSAPSRPAGQSGKRTILGSSAGTMRTMSIPGIAILPLRLFLGITFVYAGIQKITDPGFFTAGSPTYIGSQLTGFGHNSPIHFLLSPMAQVPVLFGWITILTELAIGLLVLLGLFTRLAAIGGLGLNLILFLSASWNVYPYFLGSDIVFVACWLTLVLTGPGAYALDLTMADSVGLAFGRGVQRWFTGPIYTEGDTGDDAGTPVSLPARRMVTRREVLGGGIIALGVILLGLVPRTKAGGSAPSGALAPTVGPAATPAPGAAQPTPAPASSGTQVANIKGIPVNSAFAFNDPSSGDPAVLVHTSGTTVVGFSAVCTHAGCTVQYDPSQKLLVCPCHGGAFDPANHAEVVAGPPPAPLQELPITVDSSGNVSVA